MHNRGDPADLQAYELLSVTGSDCFVEFPALLNPQGSGIGIGGPAGGSGSEVVGTNDINLMMQFPIDTNGFEKEEGQLDSQVSNRRGNNGEKKAVFYETAKFNPRQLIDLVDPTASSCNEAEDEAHLPEIQFFNQQNNNRMAIRTIKQVRENSHRLAAQSSDREADEHVHG